MKKKSLLLGLALVAFVLPTHAIVNGRSLTKTLKDLSEELQTEYQQRSESQLRFNDEYERQHQRMIEVVKESNELNILLYTQELDMTFDVAYALKKVTSEYKDFSKDIRPYDRIVDDLNYEIERYARLIEALRRLPPALRSINVGVVPDSLLYHNDSLDQHISNTASSLEKEVIEFAKEDTLLTPFVLDKAGETYRDTCFLYASELLKMYAENRDIVITDSIHYQEAYLRMKEAYDYAIERYHDLETYVFSDAQTPMMDVLASPRDYWDKTMIDLREQYDFSEFRHPSEPKDSIAAAVLPTDDDDKIWFYNQISRTAINAYLVLAVIIQITA